MYFTMKAFFISSAILFLCELSLAQQTTTRSGLTESSSVEDSTVNTSEAPTSGSELWTQGTTTEGNCVCPPVPECVSTTTVVSQNTIPLKDTIEWKHDEELEIPAEGHVQLLVSDRREFFQSRLTLRNSPAGMTVALKVERIPVDSKCSQRLHVGRHMICGGDLREGMIVGIDADEDSNLIMFDSDSRNTDILFSLHFLKERMTPYSINGTNSFVFGGFYHSRLYGRVSSQMGTIKLPRASVGLTCQRNNFENYRNQTICVHFYNDYLARTFCNEMPHTFPFFGSDLSFHFSSTDLPLGNHLTSIQCSISFDGMNTPTLDISVDEDLQQLVPWSIRDVALESEGTTTTDDNGTTEDVVTDATEKSTSTKEDSTITTEVSSTSTDDSTNTKEDLRISTEDSTNTKEDLITTTEDSDVTRNNDLVTTKESAATTEDPAGAIKTSSGTPENPETPEGESTDARSVRDTSTKTSADATEGQTGEN